MSEPKHRACRQMLEEAVRERDEAVQRAEEAERRWNELNATMEQSLADLRANRDDIKKLYDEAVKKAERRRDDAVWELAMHKEGLD